MKVVYLGNFDQSWDTESYIARAFERSGHTVVRLNEPQTDAGKTIATCREQQPDLFLFAKGRFNSQWETSQRTMRKVVEELRTFTNPPRIASWVFDLMAKEFSVERFEWAQHAAEMCDAFFTTDGFTAKQIDNGRVHVLRQAMPDDWRTPERCQVQGDIIWLGGTYGQREVQYKALKAAFGQRVWHIQEGIRGPSLCDLMYSVKVVIGPAWPMFPNYWSNRVYVVTGNAGFFVAPTIEGMEDDGWCDGTNYVSYDPYDPSSLIGQVDWWLDSRQDEQRLAIAALGQKQCKVRHTYDARVLRMIRTLFGVQQ